jgi:hypothetical protein
LKIGARVAQLPSMELIQVAPFENDSSGRGRNQLNNGAAKGGFAAARFAHDSEHFAFSYRQVHAVNRPDITQATLENQSCLDRKMRL